MNELPEEKYSEPFNEPLINSNVSDKIKTFRNNPELVVKEMTIDDKNLENILKRLADERKLCEDICDEYDIATPDIHYVLGGSSNLEKKRSRNSKFSVYQIKDNIHGLILGGSQTNNFNEVETIEFKEAAEKLLITLSQYFKKTTNKGGKWLHDIFKLNQWVYGAKKGGVQKQMYLIDVDDFEEYFCDPQDPTEKFRSILDLETLVSIANMITRIEKYLGGDRLENARNELIKVTEEILSDSPEHKEIKMRVEEVLGKK